MTTRIKWKWYSFQIPYQIPDYPSLHSSDSLPFLELPTLDSLLIDSRRHLADFSAFLFIFYLVSPFRKIKTATIEMNIETELMLTLFPLSPFPYVVPKPSSQNDSQNNKQFQRNEIPCGVCFSPSLLEMKISCSTSFYFGSCLID